MPTGISLIKTSINNPKTVAAVMLVLTAVIVLLAALPTLWPDAFPFLNSLKVDTDPENMLPANEPVRVFHDAFHDAMKREMGLNDIVVVGVVNESDPDGVFNLDSLGRIYELAGTRKVFGGRQRKGPGV